MKKRRSITVTIPLACLWAVGCARPVPADYLSVRQITQAADAQSQDRLWLAIEETLRRSRFVLDRVDRQAGVITTMPEGSQHYFEFWRHDVCTAYDFWEATQNPIRRWVEVGVIQSEGQSGQQLAIVVHKERLSTPDRQFNRTGAAYQFFGDKLPVIAGPSGVTERHEQWLDLGRDHALEDHLLRRILERAGMDAAS